MSDEPDILTKDRSFLFRINEKVFTDFAAKIEYENMNKSEFIRIMIGAFLEDDKRIIDYLNEWKLANKKDSKRSIRKREKERKAEQETEEYYGVSEDYEDIFDLLEDELEV